MGSVFGRVTSRGSAQKTTVSRTIGIYNHDNEHGRSVGKRGGDIGTAPVHLQLLMNINLLTSINLPKGFRTLIAPVRDI